MKSKNECKQNGKERQSRSSKFASISQRENAVIDMTVIFTILSVFTVVVYIFVFSSM